MSLGVEHPLIQCDGVLVIEEQVKVFEGLGQKEAAKEVRSLAARHTTSWKTHNRHNLPRHFVNLGGFRSVDVADAGIAIRRLRVLFDGLVDLISPFPPYFIARGLPHQVQALDSLS